MDGAVADDHSEVDNFFKRIGEFGPYQLLMVLIISLTAFIPPVVAYGNLFFQYLYF
jgi:hypothetical protein